MKVTQCLACMPSWPEIQFSRPLRLGCSPAFHNIRLNETERVSDLRLCVRPELKKERKKKTKNVDVSFKQKELRKSEPSLLML